MLRQKLPTSEFRRRPNYAKKYSEGELIAMLLEASVALGGILSKEAFEEYARGRTLDDGRGWPTAQTHMLRFGGWRRALVRAGLTANPSSPIAGQTLFDKPQCIDAVRHVARQLKKIPTVSDYDDYARESNGALPSAATIRHRYGAGTTCSLQPGFNEQLNSCVPRRRLALTPSSSRYDHGRAGVSDRNE